MPVISMEGGKLTAEQKRILIQRFTETASEVTQIPKQCLMRYNLTSPLITRH